MTDEPRRVSKFPADHRKGGSFILGPDLAVELEREAPAEKLPEPRPSPAQVHKFSTKKREG